jgi:diacylglycerol kinase (ATP)
MARPGERGLSRILSAARYSAKGLQSCWQHEAAFRQEVLAACILLPLGLWLGATGLEKALLCAAVLQVLIVEVLNSAIEAVVDRISTDQHPLSGRAKDLGSAAVLLSLLLAALVWGLLLGF